MIGGEPTPSDPYHDQEPHRPGSPGVKRKGPSDLEQLGCESMAAHFKLSVTFTWESFVWPEESTGASAENSLSPTWLLFPASGVKRVRIVPSEPGGFIDRG